MVLEDPFLRQRVRKVLSTLRGVLRFRFDRAPIADIDRFIEFISTRSAYVAQTSLFGYLKTRMGREYVKIFKDDEFLPSIEKAKWEIYAACLSDLSVHAAAVAAGHGRQQQEVAALARHCHERSVLATFDGEFARPMAEEVVADFARRSERTIWANVAIGEGAFSLSPVALVESSPVSDEFRELDREIVTNSIRLRWNDVRGQLRKRLDGQAIWREWERSASEAGASVQSPAGSPQAPAI